MDKWNGYLNRRVSYKFKRIYEKVEQNKRWKIESRKIVDYIQIIDVLERELQKTEGEIIHKITQENFWEMDNKNASKKGA